MREFLDALAALACFVAAIFLTYPIRWLWKLGHRGMIQVKAQEQSK